MQVAVAAIADICLVGLRRPRGAGLARVRVASEFRVLPANLLWGASTVDGGGTVCAGSHGGGVQSARV